MRLIRCPYCGAEFTRHHIHYVGADPQMQIVTGLFFIFFAVNALLVHRYIDETWFSLMMVGQLLLGAAVGARGVYKFLVGRREFRADVKRHLRRHRRTSATRADGQQVGSSALPASEQRASGSEAK